MEPIREDSIQSNRTQLQTTAKISSIITGWKELTFQHHDARQRISNRLSTARITLSEARKELEEAMHSMAHAMERAELPRAYNSDLDNGLTDDQVEDKLNDPDIGYNELTPPPRDPEWLRFIKCTFDNLLAVLLTVGGTLSLIAYGIDTERPRDISSVILGVVLYLVVLITGSFIFYQEGQSSNLMSALSAMKPPAVMVTRNGKRQAIEPRELVPGDICELQMGMLIPADIRVIECSHDLEVDNSSLTGESDPQKRTWKPESEDIIPMEAKNLCFFGTLVLNGKGVGMVVHTGDDTFMGQTAALATGTDSGQTQIQKEIHAFVTKITIIALAFGIVMFTASMILNPNRVIPNIILFFIGIVITNVPEELMAVVTIQLTITAKLLYQRNVQVKQLGSVETLGAISVICTDKTGTLTTSIMTVQHIYYDFVARECDTINPLHALEGDFYEKNESQARRASVYDNAGARNQNANKVPEVSFLKLVRCGALCNNASFLEGKMEIDPTANHTEAAIVKFASGHIAVDSRLSMREYRKVHRKLHEIPFNSRNKWQVSIHELPSEYLIQYDTDQNGQNEQNEENEEKTEDNLLGGKSYAIVQMKGAPERILNLCDKYIFEGKVEKLDDEKREEIMERGNHSLGSKGERVLAFAELVLDPVKYDINCAEPEVGEYKDERNEADEFEDCLIVNWNDEKIKIEIDLKQFKHIDDDGKEQPMESFDNLKVKHVQQIIAKHDAINVPIASQRIGFKNHGSFLEADLTLKEVDIRKGSLLHLFKGPYKFTGATAEDINIPFNRGYNPMSVKKEDDEKKDEEEEEEEKAAEDDGNDIEQNDGEGGLVFIGFFAMIDPPRPGVPIAISHCQSAGIKVVMVTGDHPSFVYCIYILYLVTRCLSYSVTAKAIAEKVGIINENAKNALIFDSNKMKKEDLTDMEFDAIVVPGWELQSVLDHEPENPQGVADFWNVVLNCDNIVFARTSPQQKLLIVSATQERGAIVAVTGDGVNDSPALKKADIGVAMGITGTEVAKESANMILLDDNFPTLVMGIEQGRIIFDNLKKSIAYSLGKNMPEVVPFIVFLVFGVPIPLTPLLLLCMDLGTDIMPSISLAMETKEADIMKRRPRDPKHDKLGTIKLIFNAEAIFGMFSAFAGLYAYFTVLNSYGFLPVHLISGIDRDYVFSNNRNEKDQRDAYYLWCYDPDWTPHCYYLPNFYKDADFSVPLTYHGQTVPYYDGYQFYQWQMNTDSTYIFDDYALKAKKFLVEVSSGGNQDVVTPPSIPLTMNMLNGKDSNGVQCCNPFVKSGDKVSCTQPEGSNCDTEYMDWDTFYSDYWIENIQEVFIEKRYKDPVYDNRFCEKDYFSLYGYHAEDQWPPHCDWDNDDFGKGQKHKTFKNSVFSIFPIAQASRTSAHSKAQTAYVAAAVIMQLANLLVVRTRTSSIFQQGMNNSFMNWAILFEIMLMCTFVYIPTCKFVLGTEPLKFVHWTPAFPFAIMALILHELKKGYFRKDEHKSEWLTRQTYW